MPASINGSAPTSTENNIEVSGDLAGLVCRQNANPRRAVAKPSMELPESCEITYSESSKSWEFPAAWNWCCTASSSANLFPRLCRT